MHVFVYVFMRLCVAVSQTYLPEPLYNRMVGTVAILVNSVLSPVVDVDVTQATHEQLSKELEGEEKESICHLPSHTEFC